MNCEALSFCGWQINVIREELFFSEAAKERSLEILRRWRAGFRRESSWAQEVLGVPSLIVRLDCFEENGELQVYEVEERPSGIGVSSVINLCFSEKLKNINKRWPQFKSLISSERKAHDDESWLQTIGLDEALKTDDLLLIRAEPEEEKFHQFQSRSVSSLVTKGDKSYGLKIGLWEKVGKEDLFNLPWDEGFCLKPLQNSKCRGVEIYHPTFKKKSGFKKIGGISTKTRIGKVLDRHGEMYLQKFLEPNDCPFCPGNKLALRVFFGFNIETGEYEFLGGVWNSRPNLKIHGALDTLMGPLV